MKHFLFVAAGVLFSAVSCQQQNCINIIPEPVEVKVQKGFFTITDKTLLVFQNTDLTFGAYMQDNFRTRLGMALNSVAPGENEDMTGAIVFKINESYDDGIGEEGYHLDINKKNIRITANTSAGLFYAFQSLYQLVPADITVNHRKEIAIPAAAIVDYPRFEWRGSHRDVSRHFFDAEHIKKHLDVMALYKLNKFHWHLTDDHGWRLQIDKYPKLTEIGAWRVDRSGTPWLKGEPPREGEEATYGGYYTKEQVKDIIAYAAQRNIEVIPEIEIPGHCSEILAAYPEFACDDYPYYVEIGPYWPPKAILCGGNDQVMVFLKDVIDEVAALFPSEYIHIGGDEAIKENWKVCPKCQKRIKDLKLENEEALQGWMIREIEKHVQKHNKRIIGWDEILDGGVTSDATIMCWRGWEGVKPLEQAARQGNQVIMTPNTHCYFDYYQIEEDPAQEAICCYVPIEHVYTFDPVPEGLSEEDAKVIKGGQCNLWAEFLYGPDEAEYMLLPRLLALSESVWSPKNRKEWERFERHLPEQKKRLGALGYNYCDEIGRIKQEKAE